MIKTTSCGAICAALVMSVLPALASESNAIHWRTATANAVNNNLTPEKSQPPQQTVSFNRRVIVQLDDPITPSQRQDLEAAGIQLLNSLGNNAFFANVQPTANTATLPAYSVLPIRREYKLQENIANGEVLPWTVVREATPTVATAVDSVPTVAVYVLLHPDADLANASALVEKHDGELVDTVKTLNGLVIHIPFDAIDAFADEDDVMWIEPSLPMLEGTNAENRAATQADVAQAPPFNLDGTGVSVFIYDAGTVSPTHYDLAGRVTALDTANVDTHATHVAGTIGGDGTASAGLYRGMAPGVEIFSAGLQIADPFGDLQILYTNPGDMETDYHTALYGTDAEISNNSVGMNIEKNGYPCAMQGEYGLVPALIDSIVIGNLGRQFRIVWAAGNERRGNVREGASCDIEGFGGFYSIGPPATAKNPVCVGAINANNQSMTYFSSWGPTDDGRLKPDVVAPGCQSDGDGGVTSCSPVDENNNPSDTAYLTACGTSMAAPTVTGLSALLIEDYHQQYPSQSLFSNAALKALLTTTADDLGNVGPDYCNGYGAVQIVDAIELMRSGNWLENYAIQSDVKAYSLTVQPGSGPVKVTLAWDDVPGTPNVYPSLVNDLDLKVYDANGNVYLPWTLDPQNPSASAVRTQEDHLNNIEQVMIDAPTPGVYRVEVTGYNIPADPQEFALVATSTLRDASSAAIVSFASPSYTCEDTAAVFVADSDLNVDTNAIDSTTVIVASETQPTGVIVVLMETGVNTSQFVGDVQLSTAAVVGGLKVSDGDVISATYIDASDGMGAIDVVRTTDTTITCGVLGVSNVSVDFIGPYGATVSFDTSLPAMAKIRYGTSPSILGETTYSLHHATSHEIDIDDLDAEQTYYFRIEVGDNYDQVVIDDNGGACYAFTTLGVDLITENFESGCDLSYKSITFTPDAKFRNYEACICDISALPTDPTGAEDMGLSFGIFSLGIPPNDFSFPFYGNQYQMFYIGASGYVSFPSGDFPVFETLSGHFSKPRISVMYAPLDPNPSHPVVVQYFTNRTVFTWKNVPIAGGTATTCQLELFYDGRIRMSYLNVGVPSAIVGLSDGHGQPTGWTEVDLTNDLASCPPIAGVTGTLEFPATKFKSISTVTVTLTDPDLDLDPMFKESINQMVYSETDTAGQNVVLKETGPATGVFAGVFQTSDTNLTNRLWVTEGDTITGTYIDELDGAGNTNVPCVATANIDDTAPVITNVSTTAITPTGATVVITADEPICGTVRYGVDCGVTSNTQGTTSSMNPVEITLTGLTPNTTYFFTLAAIDDALNVTTDDNNGACYSFTTPTGNHYYTRLFDGDNTLTNVQIRLTPNGSPEYYGVCVSPITELPYDTSAWPLMLGDDDAVEIVMTRGVINFYGYETDTFYVGSNGYITLESPDTESIESLDAHFGLSRISALFDDLDPSAGGTVSYQQMDGRVIVTYENVPEFDSQDGNTFQVEILADGTIIISYLNIAANDGLAGLSMGLGVPADYVPFELSDAATCHVAGDLNCDGIVDVFDIDPFVTALVSPEDYAVMYPDCDHSLADINGDGVVDVFDIDPFVDVLVTAD